MVDSWTTCTCAYLCTSWPYTLVVIHMHTTACRPRRALSTLFVLCTVHARAVRPAHRPRTCRSLCAPSAHVPFALRTVRARVVRPAHRPRTRRSPRARRIPFSGRAQVSSHITSSVSSNTSAFGTETMGSLADQGAHPAARHPPHLHQRRLVDADRPPHPTSERCAYGPQVVHVPHHWVPSPHHHGPSDAQPGCHGLGGQGNPVRYARYWGADLRRRGQDEGALDLRQRCCCAHVRTRLALMLRRLSPSEAPCLHSSPYGDGWTHGYASALHNDWDIPIIHSVEYSPSNTWLRIHATPGCSLTVI